MEINKDIMEVLDLHGFKDNLKNIENLDSQRILKEWRWLVGDMSILSLTKAGDLLLKDSDNKLWFLDVGIGKLKLITNNFSDFFKRKLNEEVIKEILLPQLINKLESEYRLKSNEVFGYTLLPIFGGHYDNKNIRSLS